MKKIMLTVLCFCFFLCNAQEDENKRDFIFSVGAVIQNNLYSDFNLLIGEIHNEKMIRGVSGYRIGFESNFRQDENFVIAPKIGVDVSVVPLTLRLTTVNYFQNKEFEFRILPEFGISMAGFINLTYGYGISLNGNQLKDISNHRISLNINLNKKLYKFAF